MSITPLPSAPAITDTTSEFNTKAFNWVAALDTFTTEANALASAVDADATAAAADADAAEAAAIAATAAANAELWVSGTTYAIGDVVYSPINLQSYRRVTNGAGTTDPSADATNWTQISQALVAASQAEMETGTEAALRSMSPLRVAQAIAAKAPAAASQEEMEAGTESGLRSVSPLRVAQAITAQTNQYAVPVGAINYFVGTTTSTYPGSKWLKCNGSLVTQTAYPDLYAKLGKLPNSFTSTTKTTGIFAAENVESLIYAGNLYIAGQRAVSTLGQRVATSTDLISWSISTISTTTNRAVFGLTYGNGLYVACGTAGVISTSADGYNWTLRSSGTASILYSATYGNGLYLVAGAGGAILTSTDGSTWTDRTAITGDILRSAIYANGKFVCAGNSGVIVTSTNGSTWTSATTTFANTIWTLAYGKGVYVAGCQDGFVLTSTDAATWSTVSFGETKSIRSIAFNGDMFYYGGIASTSNPATGYSINGYSWTSLTTTYPSNPSSQDVYAVVANQNGFVTTGENGYVYETDTYTYNTSTQFILPTKTSTQVDDSGSSLYIKALP